MSLFGFLMGDFEEDPYFGSHMQSMQRMNSMMNSVFADPFGLMGPPALMDHPQNAIAPMGGMQMMPFGFPPMPSLSMGRMFSDMENMSQNPNGHYFTSSSIMTMTSSPDGRPQVYQESMSTRTAPGGIKETKKTVSDSRTGTRKMAIGHHIGERAHILEREQNVHSGDQEEHQEFINLEEDEADSFNKEWESRVKHSMGAIGNSYRSHNPYNRGQQENRPLALPSTVPPTSSGHINTHARKIATPRRTLRPGGSSKMPNATTSRFGESSSNTSTSTSTSTNTNTNTNTNINTSTSTSTSTSSMPRNSKSPEVGQNLSTTSRKREHSPNFEDGGGGKRLSSSSVPEITTLDD